MQVQFVTLDEEDSGVVLIKLRSSCAGPNTRRYIRAWLCNLLCPPLYEGDRNIHLRARDVLEDINGSGYINKVHCIRIPTEAWIKYNREPAAVFTAIAFQNPAVWHDPGSRFQRGPTLEVQYGTRKHIQMNFLLNIRATMLLQVNGLTFEGVEVQLSSNTLDPRIYPCTLKTVTSLMRSHIMNRIVQRLQDHVQAHGNPRSGSVFF